MATTINWPASLPNPVYPLEVIREDAVIRSPFEAGYEQTRNRNTRRRKGYRPSWPRMKENDYNVLVQFYEVTTVDGSLSFNWTHPTTGVTGEYRFIEPIKDSLVDFQSYAVQAAIRMV